MAKRKPNGASKRAANGKQTRSKADPGKQGASRAKRPKSEAFLKQQWKPGQSGNPSGRAKKRPSLVAALIRQLNRGAELDAQGVPEFDEDGKRQRPPTVDELAVDLLRMAQKGDREALGALNTLLDRLDGKAVQPHEVTGKDGDPIEVRSARDDVLSRIARIASTSEARTDSGEPN